MYENATNARKKVISRLQWVAITVIYVLFFVVVPPLGMMNAVVLYVACCINNGLRVLLKSKQLYIFESQHKTIKFERIKNELK